MELSDLLQYLVRTFEQIGLRYLITGSTATIAYGEPRFTNDIDVVVDLPANQVNPLCDAFPSKEFYVSVDAAKEAVKERRQFNIIHPASGLKVDVMIATDSQFDKSRFERGITLSSGFDFDVTFASPEDVIIKKLEYYQKGGSQKHLRDITGVMKVMGERLDREYISRWAAQLALDTIWRDLVERTEE